MDKNNLQHTVRDSSVADAYRAGNRAGALPVLGCVLAAALGVHGLSSCNKRLEVYYSAEISDATSSHEETYIEYMNGIRASKKAHKTLQNAWEEMHALNARRNIAAWDELCDLISDERIIKADKAEEAAREVLNPRTPVGKLWLPYRGPEIPHVPTRQEQAELALIYARYIKWRPVITKLIDDNGDSMHSEKELYIAAYKVLHQ